MNLQELHCHPHKGMLMWLLKILIRCTRVKNYLRRNSSSAMHIFHTKHILKKMLHHEIPL
jgi:hypothetical protein